MRLSIKGRPIAFGLACIAVSCNAVSALAQNPAVTVNVDVAANRHPISPLVYGVSYGQSVLDDLNCSIDRLGGNNTTRYNWKINADNRGNDWYYESIPDTSATANQRSFDFVNANKVTNADSMITVPMLGWVAKLGANRAKLSSFSVKKYGAQKSVDYWFKDAGNGVRTNGTLITANANDANTTADVTFQQGMVSSLITKFGSAAGGGVRYYALDNEHSIWHATHRDVQPTGAKMDAIYAKIRDYGAMIKTQDPTALVVGPEEWGWSGFFYSGYDQQYGNAHGWSNLPDRVAHGNKDYIPYLLQQLKANENATGVRSLDVLSVHWYPQGGEFGNDVSTTMQLRRNRSTRSLWDPNYTDYSWINAKVNLIPRLKQWVATYYPGLKTAITEYNWGAESHINGATTQADILGILGREGLDIANRWVAPAVNSVTYNSWKMYRNYDGNKGSFGDVSIAATVPNPDEVSSFASQDAATGALKIMVIAKSLTGTTPVTLNLANYAPTGTAQVYQLTSTNVITRLADASVSGNALTFTAPAQSITLFVIPGQ